MHFRRFSGTAQAVMDRACVIARECNRDYLGVEFVLWSQVCEKRSNAYKILDHIGAAPSAIRRQLASIVMPISDRIITTRLEPTNRLRWVIGFAYEEARISDLEVVRTDHLLLAHLRMTGGPAYGVLESFGVTERGVRDAQESLKAMLFET